MNDVSGDRKKIELKTLRLTGNALPRSLPLIFNPLPTLEKYYEEYGDLFLVSRSSKRPQMVMLSNPQGIEQLFTADSNLFEIANSNKITKPLLGERSIFLLDGEPHQKRRKLLMPPFHGQQLHRYGHIICEITTQLLKTWHKSQVFTLHEVAQEITLRVILTLVFGLEQGHNSEDLRQCMSKFSNFFNSSIYTLCLFFPYLRKDLGKWSPWGQFQYQKRTLYELIEQAIEKRKDKTDVADILDLLLTATDETGKSLDKNEIVDEIITLMFAGHETTTSALAWAFYWIHSHPEIYQNLMDELTQINYDTEPTEVAKLPYLSAVILESLRIYPMSLFSFIRTVKEPWQLMGSDLPKDTRIAPCIYLLHHHPELYPQSKVFDPNRFLERQFSPYEFIPFGGSHRHCLGFALALYEMKLVLVTILKQVTLELATAQQIVPVRRGFIMGPSKGVPMKVIDFR